MKCQAQFSEEKKVSLPLAEFFQTVNIKRKLLSLSQQQDVWDM